MDRDEVDPYLEFVRPHYAEKDPAHDFQHIKRIIRRLDVLSEGSDPRLHLLYFLSCFHGMRDKIQNDSHFRDRMNELLKSLGWTSSEIDHAVTSLFRHTSDPQTTEEKIVCDANLMGRLGAFGIAKAFTTGGARGQSYEETADIFEYKNLDKIEFLTPMGQRVAKKGIAYAKAFLKRLRKEL
jgi:uncharacterized protein